MSGRNVERVARVRTALRGYRVNVEGLEAAIVDLLTDLYHLAQTESVSLDNAMRVAHMHYQIEHSEETGT